MAIRKGKAKHVPGRLCQQSCPPHRLPRHPRPCLLAAHSDTPYPPEMAVARVGISLSKACEVHSVKPDSAAPLSIGVIGSDGPWPPDITCPLSPLPHTLHQPACVRGSVVWLSTPASRMPNMRSAASDSLAGMGSNESPLMRSIQQRAVMNTLNHKTQNPDAGKLPITVSLYTPDLAL